MVTQVSGIDRGGGKAAQLLKIAKDPEWAIALLWKALHKADGDPYLYAFASVKSRGQEIARVGGGETMTAQKYLERYRGI